MKKALLDTNFILTSVKQKIDFFEEIKLMGIQIIIPKQVINELERITKSKQKLHNKEIAKLSLKLLEKERFKKIDLKLKNTDNGIINFAKKNPKAIIATLDKGIKSKIKNNKLVIRGKKKLEIL